MDVADRLFEMADAEYRNFHAKLIPTVPEECIIGIRTPQLRKFAKSFAKAAESEEFMKCLPHRYYEENNLHAFVIEQIKDFDKAVEETEKLLPYIDNWATCDMFMPPVFKKNPDALLVKIKEWIQSDKTYTVRYAIGLLLKLFLDDRFKEEYLDTVSKIKSDEYYINMMIAWYFATALAKQYDAAILYITENRLEKWVHNKAIQKAVESRCIDSYTKQYLKGLKR